ncbi:UDP-N-acetylmuramoylalanine/D-glutamate ligase [Acidimicrobium ferrooxidans DSM 10331]|uniref:UDP-N-acetylmuramoylalanine--D-glutamate ligase n=1 Tax=Acidimicrobium ferrooxidans (strain DSM 10331 / JCM 15462 / NBRC 103882 / ICP) TaxID=525909 RepID=C7LZM0_ACIFD|nr:UDP-N-acetylmuramoyl-L-alanine--D-glutamate ligase [Acidimicrobium ferrooxidans]ACU54178.1 UDP-N-acetylmuramoylalanine/D-glutamate ligase [Acidimicrobium ferrooxidans DSM 10331]
MSADALRAQVAGGRVLVLGASVSGLAAERVLRSLGAEVIVADDARALRDKARSEGRELVDPDAIVGARFDLVVVSPGIRTERVERLGLDGPVIGELELGYLLAAAPITAVTGTNGKSTVTTLTASMLGDGAVAAGNLGTPLSAVADSGARRLVVEVSSFQLVWAPTFRASVATVLNLTPNHLDYHGSFEAYRAAKARLIERLAPGDVAVWPVGEGAVDAIAIPRGVEVRTFSATARDADYRVEHGALVGPDGRTLVRVEELGRRAPHDVANMLAAWALAEASGAELERARRVAREFRGLAHRLQVVAVRGGLTYVDDSKATTPEAAVAAVRSFDRVVLIAGGRTKGTGFERLRDVAERIAGVVAIGESAHRVVADLGDAVPWIVEANSMDEAVAVASERALPGTVVLLAPAATSWDWYRSFEERGEDFVRAVAALGR